MDACFARAHAALLALCLLPLAAQAALSLEETTRLAHEQAPALAAQQDALGGALAEAPAATALPDPRLTLGVDNLPIGGPDRWRLGSDFMTMQRLGLMQEVPNRAKRAARADAAQARVARERAMLAVVQLAVQRDASLAWLAVHYAERRLALLAALEQENRLLQDTLAARIATGKALPAERAMAQQEALALADRRDELQRDISKARAALRRWVGTRADEPLEGPAPPLAVQAEHVRAGLHRHAEIQPYAALQAAARAAADEARAEEAGDWGWELVYSRRGPQYGDMLSFQISMDLPWQKGQRQQPQIAARLKEAQRLDAEREDLLRRHAEETEGQLAELQALQSQQERLETRALPLAAERVQLALAAYESARGDLGGVLAARREAIETRLRHIELQAQRAALRVRLTTLIAE
jgi:outer membrane protein, heavy metal efflux system